MKAINLKDIILREIKIQNININNILCFYSLNIIREATFNQKINAKMKMVDGSIKNLYLNISNEQIRDLLAQEHVVEVESDIEDLNKYFKRQISLNKLLSYE